MALADHLAPGTKETLRRTGTDVDGAAGLEDMQLLDRLQHDIGDLAYAIATVRPDAADVQVREIVIGSALLRRDTHFRRGAIGFGMCLILLCMVFNILNAWKAGDVEHIWFDTNSVAGLVFYGSAVVSIALILNGKTLPGGIVLFIMFGVPLILIFLKEPLTALIEKKSEVMPKEKGMFVVQGLFEMFEVLLSYFSNTLSFVRIGAFAVSHAAMMEVVLMLAGAESGNLNWIVVVLGNLFVCGMECLIVGIQVLRLEYYEMFSRFYKGTGRKFEPFRSVK